MSEPTFDDFEDDPNRILDLYHRTTREAAQQILRDGSFITQENNNAAFTSTRFDGYSDGYGDAIVHLRTRAALVELDDEFPDGEQHFQVPLQGNEIVGAFTLDDEGNRVPIGQDTSNTSEADTVGVWGEELEAVVVSHGGDLGAALDDPRAAAAVARDEGLNLDELEDPELMGVVTDRLNEARAEAGLGPLDTSQVADQIEAVQEEEESGELGMGNGVNVAVALAAAATITNGAQVMESEVRQAAEVREVEDNPAPKLAEHDAHMDATLERIEAARGALGVSRSQMSPAEIATADQRATLPISQRAAELKDQVETMTITGQEVTRPLSSEELSVREHESEHHRSTARIG